MVLEPKEVSTKGWNWGQVDFSGSGLSFIVANKPAFEVPLTEVANATLASKNEVMIEFASQDQTGPDGKPIKNKNDVVMEMRFYVPGMATAGKVKETDGTTRFKDVSELADENTIPLDGTEAGELLVADEELVLGEDGEALSAAAVFCETIKQKTNIGALQGEAIARFEELLCLTPRYNFIKNTRKFICIDLALKWPCMPTFSVFVENPMISKYCILPSRKYFYFQNQMDSILCL